MMTDWTTLVTNPYMGKTDKIPRPQEGDATVFTGPDDLKRHQTQWDQAKAHQQENDRLHAARLAEIDARREDERKRSEERRSAERAELEARLKLRFMAQSAATEADWAAIKDEYVRDYLKSNADEHLRRMAASGLYQRF